MSHRSRASWIWVGLCLTLVVAVPLGVFAGHNVFSNSAVGGVSIDPLGRMGEPSKESLDSLLKILKRDVQSADPDLQAPVEMRKVSLRALEAAIQNAIENNLGQLPEEIQFMAGLQRIQYILVYPEQQDIVLVGPGEGWKVDEYANIVGVTTGRPVLRLDDFLVALRSVQDAQRVGISCSIDPTPEGIKRLQAVMNRARGNNVNPAQLEQALKDAMGPQNITLNGVPPSSHYARVMVAADYHMKRLAMNIAESPVQGLPSYIDMVKNKREAGTTNPRWWMASNYEKIARTEDGLAWEIRGPGVKTLTEDNLYQADGTVKADKGKTSPIAEEWADLMTAKYDELSGKIPVFAELRNIMDLSVAAAIIEKYNLRDVGHCELRLLYDSAGTLAIDHWNAPKTVAPVCSFARTRSGWIITTSGGVQMESWQVAGETVADAQLQGVLQQAARTEGTAFWWN